MEKREVLYLNEQDICEVIAEKYKVDLDSVEVMAIISDPQYPMLTVSARVSQGIVNGERYE